MTLRSSRSHDELIQASREPLPEEFRPPRAPDFEKDWHRLWCDIFEEWSKELGVPLPKPVMPKPQRIRLPRRWSGNGAAMDDTREVPRLQALLVQERRERDAMTRKAYRLQQVLSAVLSWLSTQDLRKMNARIPDLRDWFAMEPSISLAEYEEAAKDVGATDA